MYNIIKRYHNRGIYSKENVAVFVASGKITVGKYREITETEYIR